MKWIPLRGHQCARILALLGASILCGCYSSPIVPAGTDIKAYAAGLAGRTLTLNPGGTGFNRAEGSGWDKAYGYHGLREELRPAETHCRAAGGQLDLTTHADVGGYSLPTLLRCMPGGGGDPYGKALWYLELQYFQDRAPNRWIRLHITQARVSDEAQWQQARKEAAERRQADAQRREADELRRRQALEEGKARIAKEQEARALAVAAFRSGLKPGDRFRWAIDPPFGYAVGMVVRIEGELVFVQFNNAVMGGSNTRYLKRSELEPWDGRPTGTTYNTP